MKKPGTTPGLVRVECCCGMLAEYAADDATDKAARTGRIHATAATVLALTAAATAATACTSAGRAIFVAAGTRG
jgi:hypothetical protein